MRLVGNLPYNISTPLLFHLARYADRVRDMHFMLQLEVVERMVAAHSTPAYGRLSVALQTRFRMKKLFNVCLLYTSDAADERSSVDLGGRRIIKKKKNN